MLLTTVISLWPPQASLGVHSSSNVKRDGAPSPRLPQSPRPGAPSFPPAFPAYPWAQSHFSSGSLPTHWGLVELHCPPNADNLVLLKPQGLKDRKYSFCCVYSQRKKFRLNSPPASHTHTHTCTHTHTHTHTHIPHPTNQELDYQEY